MRFYADENFPLASVLRLRELGHDVVTVYEDGRANKAFEDAKVLDRAVELDRAVLTINRIDFRRLHNRRPDHAGIVICTFDGDFVGQAERIDAACGGYGDIRGSLLRVYRPS